MPITQNDTLLSLCESLKTEAFITVDTEFLRDKTYYPQLCLIQIGTEKGAFAVDPFAPGIDLTPLFEVFNHHPVLKVFHSARQDIEILLGLSGQVPTPLFDTQVAAMVCGFGEAASYETLVTKLTPQTVDKSCRFTDWSQRPLTEGQFNYALSDVIHLREVYRALNAMLEETSRLSWLEDEMATLTAPENYRLAPEDAWKKIKIRSSSPRFVRMVKALAHWREVTAQTENIPRNHVLKEQVLLDIAASRPKTVEELRKIRNLGSIVGNLHYLKNIVEAIRQADHCVQPELVTNEERKPVASANGALVDLLKVLLKTVCENHNVAEKLVANTQDLSAIAYAETTDALMAIPAMQGWRLELFGKLALELRKGNIALSAKGDKMCIVALSNAQELVS